MGEEDIEVPFAVIENVPIFPGCENEKGNNAKKQCMSDKIAKFVNRKFNTELAADLGLSGKQRISVIRKRKRRKQKAKLRKRKNKKTKRNRRAKKQTVKRSKDEK